MQELPNALGALDNWSELRGDRRVALFLDFDGTVTPIVARPDQAHLSEPVRALIEEIAKQCSVAFITGRDLTDIRDRVGIGSLDYAGSHGFSIRMADGSCEEFGEEYLIHLDAVEQDLHRRLNQLPGIMLERKRFAISIHTRGVSGDIACRAEAVVDEIMRDHPQLKIGHGKKVLEVRPAKEWHKGRVVRWMLERWQREHGPHAPIFIGDDITDEDAFAELGDAGMTILVGSHGRDTSARYSLSDVNCVALFLQELRRTLPNQANL